MQTQNYLDPFNPVTSIKFDLPVDCYVTLKIYNIVGQEIVTAVSEYKKAGSYVISFNGGSLSSGIYFYRLVAGSFIKTNKMMLIK